MHSGLSERVNQLLEEKHLSKAKVSEDMGINYTTLWRKLRGERSIDINFLRELAKTLKTSVAFLMGETDDPSSPEEAQETRVQRVSKLTLDLETMIKDLVYEHPDLAIGFRDTRENWKNLPESTKQAIADGLQELFDENAVTSLRKVGKKGRV